MARSQINPNSKARSYGRASTAGSFISKSENQQFFNSSPNNHAFITVLGKSPNSIFKTYSKLIVAHNILVR